MWLPFSVSGLRSGAWPLGFFPGANAEFSSNSEVKAVEAALRSFTHECTFPYLARIVSTASR